MVLLVAVAIRIYAAAVLPCISRDGVFFVDFAQQLAADPTGAMRIQTKQPGYSFLLLAAHRVCGAALAKHAPLAWERTGQAISIMGGVAGVLLIFAITRHLFDANIALFAAWLAAIWPQQVALSADVLSDALHLALYLAALLAAVRALRGQLLAAIACGILAGFAYWLRQEALGAALAGAAAIGWFGAGTRQRRLIGAICVALGFIAVAAPYSLMAGRLMPNKSLHDLLFGPKTEPVMHQLPLHIEERGVLKAELPATRFIEITPHRAGPVNWWNGPGRIAAAWARSGAYVISTLALIGMLWVRCPSSRTPVRWLILIAAVFQVLAAQLRGLSFGEMSDRYLLIPTALSIPWAAVALREIIVAMHERISRSSATPSAALTFFMVALASAPLIYRALRPGPAASRWQRDAGAWLAANGAAGETVLASWHVAPLAFYSGLPRVWPAGPTRAAMIADPVVVNADWFIDQRGLRRLSIAEDDFLHTMHEQVSPRVPAAEWKAGQNPVRIYRRPPDGWFADVLNSSVDQ